MTERVLFGIVAGERSGDILGAGLIKALKAHYPGAEFVGIGGPDMEAEGCVSLAPMERLSVMGFVEPLGRLPELFRIKHRLEQYFLDQRPLAVIAIDSPDFNLRMEKVLKQNQLTTVHYVSPSVWAYREKRIHKIKQAVDLMLTLFPFETAIYKQHEIAVQCVGHPLADQIGFEDERVQNRELLGLDKDAPVVTLMPGSRISEIDRLGPVFFSAAMESLAQLPGLKFLIPCSGAATRLRITELLRSIGTLGSDQFILLDDSRRAMSAANLVVMASGTASLEAMLLRRPMVVCYRLAGLTYAIASRMVKVRHIALPNLLAGRELVPEYIQGDVTVAALRDEIVGFFDKPMARESMLAEFESLHHALRKNASATAAQAIVDLLAQQHARGQVSP
jgi:lipid-A-disaccharide synthase